MQHTDKAIAEFEVAFVAGMVEEFGEGYRSSAEHMLTDGSVIAKYAKWAWFASRRELVVELPPQVTADDVRDAIPFDADGDYAQDAAHMVNGAISACGSFVKAAGVTVGGG